MRIILVGSVYPYKAGLFYYVSLLYKQLSKKNDVTNISYKIKNLKVSIKVHPAYNFFKQTDISKKQARDKLKLKDEEKVILFFGLIREYEGLKHLLNAMKLIKEKFVKLLVAGDFVGNREEYDKLIKENGIAENVYITDGHIPIGEVEKFFAACDMVILPYESATQSGVIQVAYSFDKPVLATRVGGLRDVVFDMETGYLVEPQEPEQIAKAVIDFYENGRSKQFEEGIKREAYRYSWERMEKIIEEVIRGDL